MYQTSFWLVVFIAAFASLPWVLKWVQRRTGLGKLQHDGATRLLSSLSLSPQQRIVTVEVLQGQTRTRLVLGVTPQSITCLHTMPGSDDAQPVAVDTLPSGDFQAKLDDQKGAP